MPPRCNFFGFHAFALSLVVFLTACPKDPYDPQTWIEQLEDPNTLERALTELSHLKDPVAIEPLGKAWKKYGYRERILQTLIDIAGQEDRGTLDRNAPDFADKAEDYYGPFWKEGPFWEPAMPYLIEAADLFIEDEGNPKAIRNAIIAVNALGTSKNADAIATLIRIINKKMPRDAAGQRVRLTAIRAISHFGDDIRTVKTLIGVIEIDKKYQRVELYAAAADALAKSRNKTAINPLLRAMYRLPQVSKFARRALVAIGPPAIPVLTRVFEGKHTEINDLVRKLKSSKECRAKKTACVGPSAIQYTAATLLGDLRAKQAVPVLTAALKTSPQPSSIGPRGQLGPPQHNAILDALRKINDSSVVPKIQNYWSSSTTPDWIRHQAIDVYSFLARKTDQLSSLAKLICDKDGETCKNESADQSVRMAAAMAHARLTRSPADLAIHKFMVRRYRKAADKAATDATAAKKSLEQAKKDEAEARKLLESAMNTLSKQPKDKTASKTKEKTEAKLAKLEQIALEKSSQAKSAGYRAEGLREIQRTFEQHLARGIVGIQCKKDPQCYTRYFAKNPKEIAENIGKEHLQGFDTWKKNHKTGLKEAAIERALLEITKLGSNAKGATSTLLEQVGSENRRIREGIFLALAAVAPRPCTKCVETMDKVIASQGENSTLASLTNETQVVRYYFSWAK